jgi:hypothetical protein
LISPISNGGYLPAKAPKGQGNASVAAGRTSTAAPTSSPAASPGGTTSTYISIALLANNFDVKWVMSQVGHADSTMTMDVYAQLQHRVDRKHGTNFDRLVRRARRQLAGMEIAA